MGATIVSAPGQYLSASILPVLPSDTILSASPMLDVKIGSGFFSSLPFIVKMRLTAESLYGSQPIPYIVSVG
jgi:hypothetical protein